MLIKDFFFKHLFSTMVIEGRKTKLAIFCNCVLKKFKKRKKNLCIKLQEVVKNKTAIFSSFTDSKRLPEQLPSHFMFFNANNIF